MDPWLSESTASRRRTTLALLIAWLAFPFYLLASPAGIPLSIHLDELLVKRWAVAQGLPTTNLNNLLQTKDGYLWIASFDGLIRFDGLRFTTFDKNNLSEASGGTIELVTNGFHELAEGDDGTLWIGTQGAGVLRYRAGRFTAVPLDSSSGPRQLTIRSILPEGPDHAWVGVSDHGVYEVRRGVLAPIDEPLLRGVTVRDIARGADGALWFATEGHGLVGLSGDETRLLTVEDGLSSDAVTAVCAPAEDQVWIGTLEGLNQLSGGSIRVVPELASLEIYRLRCDGEGNLWIATDQGLYRLHENHLMLERLNERSDYEIHGVTAAMPGREGNLWLISTTAGLLRLKPSKFRNLTPNNGLASARIDALTEVGDTILIGANDGTIQAVDRGGTNLRRLTHPLEGVRIRHLLEDSAGTLWVSSFAGLLRIDGDGEHLLTTADGLPTNQVRFVVEDSAGTLWIGTRNGGVARRRGDGPVDVIDRSDGLASNFVFSIEEICSGPLSGRFLVGTRGGLNVVTADGNVERVLSATEGLPGTIVFNTLTDTAGDTWISTNGGFCRMSREGGMKTLASRGGLPSETIFDAEIDGQGAFWLSSNIGVIRLDQDVATAFMDSEIEAVESTLFDDRDGMAHRQTTAAVEFLKAKDGTLWFPTPGGLSILDPARIPKNEVPPPVHVDGIWADGKALPIRGEIVVDPGVQRLRLRFAAPSLSEPAKVVVRYRLEGFDGDWIDAGSERQVTYTNLDPMSYVFRVIAANDDGVWNEKGASLRVVVQPRFYETWGFRGAAATLLAFMTFGLFRWRMKAVRAHNRQLEETVAKQRRMERELQALIHELGRKNNELESFTYTVSHDLKSPLFTIQGFLGLLEKDATDGRHDEVMRNIHQIRQAASSMSQLLNDLLVLSRAGRITGTPELVDMDVVAEEAVAVTTGRAREKLVNVVIEPSLPSVVGDRTRLVQAIQNLVENAVKFTGDTMEPRVEISHETRDGETVFFVRDNGLGISPDKQKEIFEVFQRLDPSSDGTGIGLSVVERIVEGHGGRIWVESENLGCGSTFYFTLPGPPENTPPPQGAARSAVTSASSSK